ncbi:MAG TPA: M1 family aminopeptidase [Jatrophihabitantaceae bacterium]
MSVPRRRLGLLAVTLTLALGATACTASTSGHGASPPPSSSTSQSSPTSASSSSQPSTPSPTQQPACPTSYAAPDPKRPRVRLAFAISADLATVQGTEHVEFTPDLPITELVFRLTANTAPTVAAGNKIVVHKATADHGARAATYTTSGAAPSTQGGLLHIPFASRIPAGTTVSADLTFTVTLGRGAFDRFGRTSSGYAWFASAHPLLAWERGGGWHTEPMIKFTAESATSEAMQTDLTVIAPAADTVIMSGDPPKGPPKGGFRTWHSTIDAARDVSIAVGPFAVVDTTVNGVKLRVGAPSARERDQAVPLFKEAITAHAKRFGPFPFPSLSVAQVPAGGGGIEYPSSILMLGLSRVVAVHETAHQWFYAMVGDSQAQHAWLDEAFASYAEQLADGSQPPLDSLTEPGNVDRPTASYGGDVGDYYSVTYDKGAAALHAARAAAGPARFDAAIRCYVNANAWRIANPSDLRRALNGLPGALAVLRKAHALP